MGLCLCRLAGKSRFGVAVPPRGFTTPAVPSLTMSALEYNWKGNMEISDREDTQRNWNEFAYPLHIFSLRLLRIQN